MKSLIILFIIIVITSCNIIVEEIPIFKKHKEVVEYCHKTIKYKEDKDAQGVDDYMQWPNETVVLGTGDCDDKCIIYGEIVRVQFGHEVLFVNYDHHWTVFNKTLYKWVDPTTGFIGDKIEGLNIDKATIYTMSQMNTLILSKRDK